MAIQRYFSDCQSRVPEFVQKHFALPGALHTNKGAFGWDILRAPINLIWAPFYALLSIVRWAMRRIPGSKGIANFIQRAPSGWQTTVQRRCAALIQTEILGDTTGVYLASPNTEKRRSIHDYFLECWNELSQHEYKDGNTPHSNRHLHSTSSPKLQYATKQQEALQDNIHEAVTQYQISRTATADIGNSLSCTALGAFAFQQFTPGGVGIAVFFASWLSKQQAIQTFIFGETLGRWYYTLFPPSPTPFFLTISILSALTALSIIAAFSGFFLDPIQAWLGLHEKRLRTMLSTLESDAIGSLRGGFKPKDQYLARILDTLDAAKSVIF